MRRISRSRRGTTLIETLVAVGLVVVLIGLSTPLVRLAAAFQFQDGEFQTVAAFDESLQTIAAAKTLRVSGRSLILTDDQGSQHLELYRKTSADPPMLRVVTGAKKGHMPMLIGVQTIQWQQSGQDARYELTMASGRRYEGVVVAE